MFAALLVAAATPALAHPPRPAEDVARDAARHPAEMVAFAKIGKGTMVADFVPGSGYFTRVFSEAAEPGGVVTAIIPAIAEKLNAKDAKAVRDLAADAGYGNIVIATSPAELAPGSQDVVWTAQNYHDFHNSPAGAAGVAPINKAIFAVLKPGGLYVIVDHAAAPGSGTTTTQTLHRIDPAVLKAEVVAAGFVFDGESKVLANPADDHSKMVFDPAIRGKTDQFVYRFRKP